MSTDQGRLTVTFEALAGAVLAQLREDAGMTQAEAAAAVGLTQSSYSRLESGLTGMRLGVVERLLGEFCSDLLDFRRHLDEAEQFLVERYRVSVVVLSKKADGPHLSNQALRGLLETRRS